MNDTEKEMPAEVGFEQNIKNKINNLSIKN